MKFWLPLGLLLALPLATSAQEQNLTEDQQAEVSKVAHWDLGCLEVLDTLQLDRRQARDFARAARLYQTTAKDNAERWERELKAGGRALAVKHQALLQGQPIPATAAAACAKLELLKAELDQDNDDSAYGMIERALGALTEDQAKLVTDADTAALGPDELLQQRLESAQRRQALELEVERFILTARREPDPRRYAQLAPAACAQTVTALTGLAPGNAVAQRLTAYFLQQVTRAYNMRPVDLNRQGAAIVSDLVTATQQAMAESRGETVRPAITRDQLERALRYERTEALLNQLAQYRQNRPDRQD